jgi:hypothetical protein
MARAHNKPSTAQGWRFDDDPTAIPPRWTASAGLIPGRFHYEGDLTAMLQESFPILIYLPWGTDVRIGPGSGADGDIINLTAAPNIYLKVYTLHVLNPDTPDRELRAICATRPFLTFPIT